jgi:hypothetical protein
LLDFKYRDGFDLDQPFRQGKSANADECTCRGLPGPKWLLGIRNDGSELGSVIDNKSCSLNDVSVGRAPAACKASPRFFMA